MEQGQSKPARPTKKKLIQLVHIGKAKMGLSDDVYRAFLVGITGKQSSAEMTTRQLQAVLKAMRKNGFDDVSPRRVRPEERGGASLAQLEYIKGMWQKCARNKSEAALISFVHRITRVKTLRFLTVETAREVILALRDMMKKAGFDLDTSEAVNG